jgi:hypothetical protein
MSGMTSATAPVILACRSSTFAGKSGKYISSLTNPHKKKSCGVKLWDQGGQPTH